MKFLIYTDVHFSETSSLIHSQGNNYTTRLEKIIEGINWAEEQATTLNCDAVLCLGDFFDKSNLTSQEITALKEIKWSDLAHYFLVGNHEGSEHTIEFNSINALRSCGFKIIDAPYNAVIENCDLSFIPYITEYERKSLKDYLEPSKTGRRIIFSHNDIKGLQYGRYTSVDGFDIEEIDNNCNLFLNGHLHNGTPFSKKGINLGNFTGQNFLEDSFTYNHCCFILDTDTLKLEAIENPYAFNFYKFDINFEQDIHILDKLKNNAVISVRCIDYLQDQFKEALEYHKDKIIEKRINYFKDDNLSAEEVADNLKNLNASDYIQQFQNFVIDKLGTNEVVVYELQQIIK